MKRDNRRLARAVRQESEAEGMKQKEAIKQAVAEAKEEGFPTDTEEKEGYFMGQVAKGESLCADGESPRPTRVVFRLLTRYLSI